MSRQDMVASVFAKLSDSLASVGIDSPTEQAEQEQLAKFLGLVEGVKGRNVGVGLLKPTDKGLLFIGVDPSELAKAKEKAAHAAKVAKLEAELAAAREALEV